MKLLGTILLALFCQLSAESQTKVYFSAGKSVSTILSINNFYIFGQGARVIRTKNDYDTQGISEFWTGELWVETRLNKVLNGVTGVSIFRTGYDNAQINNDPSIGDFFSKLDITYLGIPLLWRANIVNAVNLDMGFMAFVPISAVLNETRNKGNEFEQHHKGTITSSLSSLGIGGYLGFTILINRFTVTASWQNGTAKVDKALLDSWPIGNGSMFLVDMYPNFYFEMIYLKLGIRLK